MTRLLLGPEARHDALHAFEFYEDRRRGLGGRFRDHLAVAMEQIRQDPLRYPIVYRELRRRLVERFPYAVIYRAHPDLVFVVAIFHGRRNPSAWKSRAHEPA